MSSAESDRRVLEALNESTGEKLSGRRGWMSAAPLSEWGGVTVCATGRVTRLLLGHRDFSGLTMLTSSDVSY